MITINWSNSFKRSFRKITSNDSNLRNKILEIMKTLQTDPFSDKLRTHKLKGILEGVWSCSVNYNIRLVFDFVKNSSSGETEILLIDIGTHDEIY